MIKLKRVYEKPDKSDGFRVLVDRLWPRGFSKQRTKIDLWVKELAPSTELRKWFGHDPKKWDEFQKRYEKEIRSNPDKLAELVKIIKDHKIITLIFAASDEEMNNAVVLKKILSR